MYVTYLIPKVNNQQVEKGPYEVWKESHPNGTPQEFLDYMKKEVSSNLLIQEQPPDPKDIKTDVLWIQKGMGENGNGITLNLVRKK